MIVGTSTIVGIGVEVTNVEAMTVEMEEKNVIIADVITDDDEKGFAVWRNLCYALEILFSKLSSSCEEKLRTQKKHLLFARISTMFWKANPFENIVELCTS